MFLGLGWNTDLFNYARFCLLLLFLLSSVLDHCGIHPISTVLRLLQEPPENQKLIVSSTILAIRVAPRGKTGTRMLLHLGKVNPAPVMGHANTSFVRALCKFYFCNCHAQIGNYMVYLENLFFPRASFACAQATQCFCIGSPVAQDSDTKCNARPWSQKFIT